jgi:hypothetical protein
MDANSIRRQKKLLASICAEAILLKRDRAGGAINAGNISAGAPREDKFKKLLASIAFLLAFL